MQTETTTQYYQTIHDLPLNKFIDCDVDGNLSALVISGYPTPEQLGAAWNYILSQYSELVGTYEYKMYVELYREVNILRITLDQIAIAVGGEVSGENGEKVPVIGMLRLVYNESVAKTLNELLNTKCRFNWADQKSYHAECDKCIRRSKAIRIKLDLKNLQFAAIEKKNKAKKGEKTDRQYYVSVLVTLSDFAKYRIEETIKMSEYCERIRRFSDYCEQVKNRT